MHRLVLWQSEHGMDLWRKFQLARANVPQHGADAGNALRIQQLLGATGQIAFQRFRVGSQRFRRRARGFGLRQAELEQGDALLGGARLAFQHRRGRHQIMGCWGERCVHCHPPGGWLADRVTKRAPMPETRARPGPAQARVMVPYSRLTDTFPSG